MIITPTIAKKPIKITVLNLELGMGRAKFVELQIKDLGIIYTKCESKGEKDPRYDNNTSEGKAKNRRVDLQIQKIIK